MSINRAQYIIEVFRLGASNSPPEYYRPFETSDRKTFSKELSLPTGNYRIVFILNESMRQMVLLYTLNGEYRRGYEYNRQPTEQMRKDLFVVLGTAADLLGQVLQHYGEEIDSLVFQATKGDIGKVRLYDHFAERLAAKYGGRVDAYTTHGEKFYTIYLGR